MPEPVWPKPLVAPQPQGRVNLMVGERELTQLAQLGLVFAILRGAGVSLIKGLGGAKERFERVVTTLGIF